MAGRGRPRKEDNGFDGEVDEGAAMEESLETAGVDDAKEQEMRIADLEDKIRELEKRNLEVSENRYVLLATVPEMRVKISYHYPAIEVFDKGGKREMVSKECSTFLCAHTDDRGKGVDPKYPGQEYEELLYQYPNGEPIPTRIMRGVVIQGMHSEMGIVVWDRANESKAEARVRGLQQYIAYIDRLKIKLDTRHMNMRERNHNVFIPDEESWKSRYPLIWKHINKGWVQRVKYSLSGVMKDGKLV